MGAWGRGEGDEKCPHIGLGTTWFFSVSRCQMMSEWPTHSAIAYIDRRW
jgi:hypothetical protein